MDACSVLCHQNQVVSLLNHPLMTDRSTAVSESVEYRLRIRCVALASRIESTAVYAAADMA
ncbi:hypothetical protein DIPPA_14299 [Diplonema papillatum]|nr:hypothetical protein DIPPA_14288 [Diplonema papillatum]KAJ9456063.1 hypothetical protein DIPPA_14303 [Diplonema papillatum]KAJ9456064.1 hypothetical protein DIPPA_14291 [Diplonema papillatum]KAJ9456068.1 hypothetical protein DIPPA_14294 [Diplonema papillatum]KAJ9456069.1 hypothetical protein DIPPA_14299 [Diplonema papillatum]